MNNQQRIQARIARDKARKAAKRQILLDEYGTFEKVISNQALHKSLKKRRKGVEWKGSVQRYLQHGIVKVKRTKDKLHAGELDLNRTVKKMRICERGKIRDVQGVLIDTRVVQGALCDSCITPLMQNTLIYDNPASTKGKGVEHARNRIVRHLQKLIRRYGPEFYVLTDDFAGFFDSISHRVCDEIAADLGVDDRLRTLIMFCMKMYMESEFMEIKDKAKREEMLTKLYNNELCGATLGSQESQDFALVVPNKVDHLVKDAERIKEYIRYMDDGFAGHKSKQRLRELLGKMEVAAKQQGLTLNMKKTRITKSSRGFTFLKVRYIVTETGKIIKKMVKSGIVRMRRKLKKYRSLVDQGRMSLDDVFASVKSWFGNATKIGKTYRARKAILCLYNKLFKRYRTGGMLA